MTASEASMAELGLWGDEPRAYRLAAGVYAIRDGRAAFLQRAPGGTMPGFWSIPGGMVDPGEDPLTAALRELHEEAGLTPTGPAEYLCALPFQAYGLDILRFHYVAPCASGDIALSHEHSDAAWLTPEHYRDAHLDDAQLTRWSAVGAAEAFNVHANREAIASLVDWLAR
jgi:8-oxo-dGTP pyrophosphatase MutT (NUDIX family)